MITPDHTTDKTLDIYDPKNPELQMHPAPATNPTAQSLFGPTPWVTNAGSFNAIGGWANFNPWYFATQETAGKLAQLVGGVVVDDPNLNEGPIAGGHPARLIEMPNGTKVNAGELASYWAHGWPRIYIEEMVSWAISGAAWKGADGITWKYPPEPETPVAAAPVVPAHVLPPGVVGTRVHADAPEVDGFELGYSAARADGSDWRKDVRYTPFGVVWFWECVKGGA